MSKKKREGAKRRQKKRVLGRQHRRHPHGRHGTEFEARDAEVDIHREIRYITELAQAGDAHLVTLGNLVMFSTESHDAWLLDRDDRLALCLLRDGQPQPHRIIDTPDTFAIEWSLRFEIVGSAFLVMENSGEVRSIQGYPTVQIADACTRKQ